MSQKLRSMLSYNEEKYERDLGTIQFKENGYDILWGLDQGRGRPTSELPAHVLCHRARPADDANNKINALSSYLPECNDDDS